MSVHNTVRRIGTTSVGEWLLARPRFVLTVLTLVAFVAVQGGALAEPGAAPDGAGVDGSSVDLPSESAAGSDISDSDSNNTNLGP